MRKYGVVAWVCCCVCFFYRQMKAEGVEDVCFSLSKNVEAQNFAKKDISLHGRAVFDEEKVFGTDKLDKYKVKVADVVFFHDLNGKNVV